MYLSFSLSLSLFKYEHIYIYMYNDILHRCVYRQVPTPMKWEKSVHIGLCSRTPPNWEGWGREWRCKAERGHDMRCTHTWYIDPQGMGHGHAQRYILTEFV